MTDEEFHRLVDELISGAESGEAIARLACALKIAVVNGGDKACESVRDYCRETVKLVRELGLRKPRIPQRRD